MIGGALAAAAGAGQATSILPSPAVAWMPVTAGMAGGGVGAGVGGRTAVNVQVASWSATATAVPASSAVWNTVCGHSKVAPLTQAGMSLMIRMLLSPASSAARSFAARPIPTGRMAIGERLPNSRSMVGCTRLAGTPATSCLPSVNMIRAGRAASAGRCLAACSSAWT